MIILLTIISIIPLILSLAKYCEAKGFYFSTETRRKISKINTELCLGYIPRSALNFSFIKNVWCIAGTAATLYLLQY